MPAAAPERQAEKTASGQQGHSSPPIYTVEAAGLLIISLLLLLLILIRSWNSIYWGWR